MPKSLDKTTHKTICAIDYGAKRAGTTAISFLTNNLKLFTFLSEKGKDADKFILEKIFEFSPSIVGIDAPLSIPCAYNHLIEKQKDTTSPDFHLRKCDRELKAMSPMFLGGLTARAISLAYKIKETKIEVIECYPKATLQHLNQYKEKYKKRSFNSEETNLILKEILYLNGYNINIRTWHEFDSLLALVSVIRYSLGEAISYGDKVEGLIYV